MHIVMVIFAGLLLLAVFALFGRLWGHGVASVGTCRMVVHRDLGRDSADQSLGRRGEGRLSVAGGTADSSGGLCRPLVTGRGSGLANERLIHV